jgi:hypothetical protein
MRKTRLRFRLGKVDRYGRNSKVTNFLVDFDEVLRLKSRLCDVGDLRRKVLRGLSSLLYYSPNPI